MAMAMAHCKCSGCGEDFTIRKKCYNRRDADSFEAYAASHYDECSVCYAERKRREAEIQAAELQAKFGLPMLAGTEKQIAFANRLRAEHVSDYYKLVDPVRAFIQHEMTSEFVTTAAEQGYNLANYRNAILKSKGCRGLYLCLKSESAGEIIDAIHNGIYPKWLRDTSKIDGGDDT